MFQSLKAKLFLLVCGILGLVTVLVLYFTHRDVEQAMFAAEQRSARNVLELVMLNIRSGYRQFLWHRLETLDAHRRTMRSTALAVRQGMDSMFLGAGGYSEARADVEALILEWMAALDGPDGMEFFIFDEQERIVGSRVESALGQDAAEIRDLIGRRLVDVVRERIAKDNEASTSFSWTWTEDGEPVTRFGYFFFYPETNWTVGVSVSMDALELERDSRRLELLTSLRTMFGNIRIAESGFLLLFSTDGEILIQPKSMGWEPAETLNILTGRPVLEDLRNAAESRAQEPLRIVLSDEHGSVRELEGLSVSFEPLGWFVATIGHLEEISAPARGVVTHMSWIFFAVFLVSLGLGLSIASLIAKPLKALADYAASLSQRDITGTEPYFASIAQLATNKSEVGRLAAALIFMETSLRENIRSLLESTAVNERMAGELTERQRTEAQLIEARQRADAASRTKSAFLANMSHEIRTPLNAVLGFAQILDRDPSLTSEQARHVRTIVKSGDHLLRLVNDILDMAKIEAGKIEVTASSFDLWGVLHELESLFRPQAITKGLALGMEGVRGLPRFVHGDHVKLRQILANLLSNAIKFTKTGSILLKCGGASQVGLQGQEQYLLRIEVADSGPGLDSEELRQLFDPFYQASKGVTEGGTGLGLSISRNFAALLGGDLEVESKPGQGSLFRLTAVVDLIHDTVPIPKAEPRMVTGLESSAGPNNEPWRILAVDDKPENLRLIEALLLPLGFGVRTAVNGADALDIFAQWSPHAVLMDIRMPVMDGFEATRRIKATEQGASTFVVAMTAGATTHSREEVLLAGLDAHLPKPYRAEELFEVLRVGLGLRYRYADPAVPEAASGPAGTRTHSLSQATVEGIAYAASEGDYVLLTKLINESVREDPRAAAYLWDRAEFFDYEEIKVWLERAGARHPNNTG